MDLEPVALRVERRRWPGQGADPGDAGGRRVIFVSGDDRPATDAVVELFDAAGFFVIDLGDLVSGGRMPQFGGPLAGHDLVRLPPDGR